MASPFPVPAFPSSPFPAAVHSDDRQSHHPRRDLRHAHGNAHARIRPRRHLRTPTVLWGPWSMTRGTSAASPPSATKGTPPAPTGPGSKASTHRPQANLPIRRASVPRSPNTSKQVGVSVSYATSQQTRAKVDDQNASAGRPSPHQKSAFLHHLGGQH